MSDKVTLKKEEAKMLEALFPNMNSKVEIFEMLFNGDNLLARKVSASFYERFQAAFGDSNLDAERLMNALVNGYDVEETPEDKVRDYCNRQDRRKHTNVGQSVEMKYDGRIEGVVAALDMLGITIEGVND